VPRVLRITAALGAVLFALVGLSACGGLAGDAVVSVDGNSITKDTFNHWMGVASASSAQTTAGKPSIPIPPKYTACIAAAKAAAKPAKGQTAPTEAALKSQCAQQYKTLQQEVLGFLISSNWVLGEAKSLGVKISDKEVKKQFEKIKSQQFPKSAEFEKFLKTSGQTVSDLLLRVKLNLLSQKIQQKIVKQKSKVTQADIAKYYKENPKRFSVAEKRDLLIILTKTEAQAKKAKQEIESGKSFESVAKRVSIDPTSKANGGKLPGVVKGQEEKSLDAAVFSAKKGALSGPIKTPFGYYIFEVQSTTPGSQQSLKQAEASIKSQLTATRQQSALSRFVKDFKKKWMSKTDCRAGYVVTDCKQYKAPKTSSTSTPATSVPTSTAATPTTTTPATTSTK
jgi:foldase protein PrsA